MLRIAKPEDRDAIKILLDAFIAESPYKKFPINSELFYKYIDFVLKDPSGIRVVVLAEEDNEVVGLAAAEVIPWLFTDLSMAREMAIYIKPEYRKKGIGKELIGSLEYWATKVGCKYIQLNTLRKDCDKLYKDLGYEVVESIYLKGLEKPVE